MISVSIVSHGHGAMVERLIEQVLSCPEVGQLIVTYNVPEAHRPIIDDRLEIVTNTSPVGFGANHNRAFQRCREPFWCVLNPDVELLGNPFPILLESLEKHQAGVVAPLVTSPAGQIEDSIRYFPTLLSLALKLLGRDDGAYAVERGQADLAPEWVAGMFMLFRARTFAALKGFDERYYLYYEDVDICWRAWRAGTRIVACPSVGVVHDARRASRVSWRHRGWHLASMLRFLIKSFARRRVEPVHGA